MTVKINFAGGIISPGELYKILDAVQQQGTSKVSFGLRQQLLIEVNDDCAGDLTQQLKQLGVIYETGEECYPNIISSYPAEEIFITGSWVSEGVYQDIFDMLDFQPKLKINISNSNQSFTPMLTGNINWVAALEAQHFWHLFIRFPKTNTIYEWTELVYTNDVARMSRHIEELIFRFPEQFYDNPAANGLELFQYVNKLQYITRAAAVPARLPAFNLPYYEGLNRYQDKFWLGVYRRDELFSVAFLKEACQLCLHTKIGQICSTPWKTIIIKNIAEKDRGYWNSLLAKYQVNVRHAANELNFQVEDNCKEGLDLKHFLLSGLHTDDVRTFGICIGIKTRKKSEVFSSILVRKRPWISFAGICLFSVYDILCAKDFNPNQRTGTIYSKGNYKFFLAEQLRRAIFTFYKYNQAMPGVRPKAEIPIPVSPKNSSLAFPIYQCKHCLSVYDEKLGEPANDILAGTSFAALPLTYCCELCGALGEDFVKTTAQQLQLLSA